MFHHEDLFREARWLLERIAELREGLMADLTNLTKAVSDLEATETAVVQALANASASDQPAVDALTQRVAAVTTGLNDAVAPPAAPAAS